MSISINHFSRPTVIDATRSGYQLCLYHGKQLQRQIMIVKGKRIIANHTLPSCNQLSCIKLIQEPYLQLVYYNVITGMFHNIDIASTQNKTVPSPCLNPILVNNEEHLLIFNPNENNLYRFNTENDRFDKIADRLALPQYHKTKAISCSGDTLYFLGAQNLCAVSLQTGRVIKLKKFESGREGRGYFRNPTDIVCISNMIAVFDRSNYLIQFLSFDFEFLYQIGGKGSALGQFDLATKGYADKENLYICDYNNDRVVSFNTETKAHKLHLESAFTPGELRRPSGLTSDGQNLYVPDRSNQKIQCFDTKLNFCSVLPIEFSNNLHPCAITYLDSIEGPTLCILERNSSDEGRLVFLQSNLSNKWQKWENKINIRLNDPQDLDSNGKELVYIADTLNRQIIGINISTHATISANLITHSKQPRILIKSISTRSDGHVFTADFEHCALYEFDAQLNFIDKIDLMHLKEEIHVIRAVLATQNGFFICGRGTHPLRFVDLNGKCQFKTNGEKETGLPLFNPTKMLLTDENMLLIADKENDRLTQINVNELINC